MKNYLVLKYLTVLLKKYTFIFLTAIIFTISHSTSFSEENVFTINNVKVKGTINLNFSRNKYLNQAFLNSFRILMNRILLTRDLGKVDNTDLKQVKKLINSFQILEESYRKEIYSASIKIFYNEKRIKKFLAKKNISFSRPENISAIFFPVFYVNDEFKSFNENFFYTEWLKIKIKNELINFILPLEDLEDIAKITEMRSKIEKMNIDSLVNKYAVENYAFALMDYQGKKLNIYLLTNFNNNKLSKNISYEVLNIKDQEELSEILKDLKLKITDTWKEANLVNLLAPLSVKIRFQHNNLKEMDKLKNTLARINIIDDYVLEEFDIHNSFFKIYYYSNPKKLKSELTKFKYDLKNNQGSWQIYKNE